MKFVTLLLVLASIWVQAQAPAVDLQREKQELLRLHQADREAHMQTDVDRLLQTAPEEFISVSGGKIYRATKADERKQFVEYFKDVKYSEWDNLEEPIVRVSRDGSMAWMITRLKSRRTQKNAAGKEVEQKFVYAGIMTYEKQNGRWIRIANVSTFESSN